MSGIAGGGRPYRNDLDEGSAAQEEGGDEEDAGDAYERGVEHGGDAVGGPRQVRARERGTLSRDPWRSKYVPGAGVKARTLRSRDTAEAFHSRRPASFLILGARVTPSNTRASLDM